MGICYEIFIFDEFDWDYIDWNKSKTIEQVMKVCPWADLKANMHGLLIFDIDKCGPSNFIGKVKMDAMMYRQDDRLCEIVKFDK